MKWCAILITFLLLTSCKGLKVTKDELGDGYYRYKEGDSDFQKVFLKAGDTLKLYNGQSQIITVRHDVSQTFIRPSFDADVLIAPFKYRPPTAGFHRQLNTSFNGNIYLGYRLDRFRKNFVQTPAGTSEVLRHSAISLGLFGGIGSTFVSPWTTNYVTTEEYDGFIFSYGTALIFGTRKLNAGLALGFDHLNDHNREIWIYQNKAWLGVVVGLNIN